MNLPERSQKRRTKIVATVGPASREPAMLEQLINAGVDVFRLNFSHGTAAEHIENIERIRSVSDKLGKLVGILGDLPGPKLRLDEVENGVVRLNAGKQVLLTTSEVVGDEEQLPVGWEGFTEAVSVGDPVFLADGRIRMTAIEVTPAGVRCEIETGGTVASHQGINLPASSGGMPATGASDMDWVEFAVDNGVDLLAVSFVRAAADLEPIHERLASRGSDIPLIAKIEKPQGADNAEEIIAAATSGIMVARGDLGIELPIEAVPAMQKRLIWMAGRQSKPVITATQMLASMVTADRPTRAEVTDVANAIHDGTDAVMLSEETAVGENPVAAVSVMDRVARETERELPYGNWLMQRTDAGSDIGAAVAQSAVAATYRLDLKAIVVPTRSGRTARLVSALRPSVQILAISPRMETVRRLNLLFGVECYYHGEWGQLQELLDDSADIARIVGVGAPGELIAITAGLPSQEVGTNLFEVHRVPEAR